MTALDTNNRAAATDKDYPKGLFKDDGLTRYYCGRLASESFRRE
jgi:hypothetical protein